jgi:hypothetical protein
MNNNTIFRVFIRKVLGGLNCDVAIAMLNDNIGSVITMDKLVDKVKQIYDTYADENTYFERIALVGCDTDGASVTDSSIVLPSNGFSKLSL